MRLKTLLMTIMTASLLIGGSAFADDAKDFPITGTVELGIRNVQDGDKSAKFNQYRDLKSGVFGNMQFGGDNGSYYMNMTGENIGRDDQFFEVKGGQFGSFDYSVHYNEIIHNLSFGARTFYTNPGSNNLDYGGANTSLSDIDRTYRPAISTDPNQWGTFDYSIKRKDTGAAIDFTFGTPFFVSVDANQLETKGIQPRGTASDIAKEARGTGTSSGNIEMPAPIDYRTNNLNIKAGYNTKKYSFSLGGTLSRFDNQNEFVTFRNPFVVSQDRTEYFSQASDNSYYKLMMQGSVRQLPLNSALALKIGWSKLENTLDLRRDVPIATAGANNDALPTYSTRILDVNTPRFEGNIKYQTASLALTSEPMKGMDTKIYFNYLRKTNDSTQVEYSFGGNTVDNELFNYRKYNLGADLGYRITPKTKATVGYEFTQTDRERIDAESTTDNSAYVEIKNSSLEWLTAKLKYARLWRNSDFQGGTNSSVYEQYIRKFDASSKVQDSIKLALDIDPTENFNVGLEYTFKNNDYVDGFYGRSSDTRNEYYVDMSFNVPDRVKLTAFFDYETVRNMQSERQTSGGAIQPSIPSTSASYLWTGAYKDSNYYYGVGAQAPVIKNKLDFIMSWTYEQANGQVDFTSVNNFGAAAFVDVPFYDDYTKQAFNLKAIYKALKNLDLTFGYAYEHYTYSDLSTQGYQNLVPNPTSPTMFYTGAYADSDYNVNMFYMVAGYKF